MRIRLLIILSVFAVIGAVSAVAQTSGSWIRINQLGYLPTGVKTAVYISASEQGGAEFRIRDKETGRIVLEGVGESADGRRWGMKKAMRLDFSRLRTPGEYLIECNGAKSPAVRIDPGAYDGTADFILKYMRQQRCGYNPGLDTLCHQHDGYIVDHPAREGERVDVRGGWHDASDCLQYLTTSANATFQMLFAWQQTPDKTIFKDEYDACGRSGANGLPDILDEVRWGLDWMVRMYPDSTLMFNQIADDRDHAGMRLPSHDSVDYGYGPGVGRPVYPVTGKPQGLVEGNLNRSTGVASSAAKFASAFALGGDVFGGIDPEFSSMLKEKAGQAYRYGKKRPGNNQTACNISPYFYEEDNWVDDMELAAAVKYGLSGTQTWLKEADYWGRLEEITPWMELGRARHYQFYPFVNLGHYYLAQSSDPAIAEKYAGYMRRGLECLMKRAGECGDPFLNGVPFVWCSNNLVVAAATQARLYNQITGDETYAKMEAALRDWLFGCNPWGTSMICGLPVDGDYPSRTHSYVTEILGDLTWGGLVDGPIYRTLFETLEGIRLHYEDDYAPFQHGAAVYHDDPGDYSSNEPTMDGTASLSFYLSSMEKEGRIQKKAPNAIVDDQGAVRRFADNGKTVYLLFPADSAFEGAGKILRTLDRHNAKASFFLTGNCLRIKEYAPVIRRIIRRGHYLGGHSDAHLLYADWENRRSLVGVDSLTADFRRNMDELKRFGVDTGALDYYLPPYEWYNRESVRTVERMGQITVNYTPGIPTAADYTTPDMKNYRSSDDLLASLYEFEARNGLGGCMILIHPGTHVSRTDKLYDRLGEMIGYLRSKGYVFKSL